MQIKYNFLKFRSIKFKDPKWNENTLSGTPRTMDELVIMKRISLNFKDLREVGASSIVSPTKIIEPKELLINFLPSKIYNEK